MTLCILLVLAAMSPGAAAPGTQAVVRSFEAHYVATRTLQAVFLERYSEGRQPVRAESGMVYFSRPNRMRWDYESPSRKLFLADGKLAWLYVPADHTASRTPMKESDDWHTPIALLAGQAKVSKVCSVVTLIPPAALTSPGEHLSSPGNYLLRCTPRGGEEKSGITDILLELDTSYRLVRVVIQQQGELETEFRFGNWQENIPLPEGTFHFEPPSGVAIVDQTAIPSTAQ
jgi:outer membrane lipoprotein carrier protein